MEIEASFHSGLGDDWKVDGSYYLPVSATVEDLQTIVLQVLSKQADLGFSLNNQTISNTLEEVLNKQQISIESKINIEFYIQIPPLESQSDGAANDWISSIKIYNDVFAADYSGCITVHNENSQKPIQISQKPLKSIDISEQGIISVSLTGDITITDLEFQTLASGKTERSSQVIWNVTASSFAVGGTTGSISIGKISDFGVQKGQKRLKTDSASVNIEKLSFSHTENVSGLAWPSLETLITSSFDHTITIFDLEKSSIQSSVLCPRSVQSFKYLGNLALAGYENGIVSGYDMRSCSKVLTFDYKHWVRAIGVAGNAVVVGGESGYLSTFDMRSQSCSHSVRAHEGKILCLDISETQVATGGEDSLIKTYKFSG